MSEAFAAVVDHPIDPAALLGDALTSEDGAALLFWGVVRDHHDGRAVTHLEYRAYAAMAEREMLRIAREARERFAVGGVRVVHRVGRLAIGEASVGIAVASPHRDAAYQASRYVIEELKRRVPVWKREGYTDGTAEWVPGFTVQVGQ
jgi:molybdopterin synthase catalytic subunit